MTTYIGIDCGLNGAVAVILPDRTVAIHDTPTISVPTGRKTKLGNPITKRLYSGSAMSELLRQLAAAGDVHVCLEKQQAMPGQRRPGPPGREDDVDWKGVSVVFTQGLGYGLWQGLLYGIGLPFSEVHPLTWKRQMLSGQPGKDKGISVLVGSQLFPAAAQLLRGPRGAALHDRGDALLIAEYGRRTSTPSVTPSSARDVPIS